METQFQHLQEGLYAIIQTTQGNLLVKFFHEESPVTVANFIGLAEGSLANHSKKQGEPFYNGTIFHRIIKDFMIQGGDPQGNGMGGPGYQFEDEKNELQHTKKGMLSMANSGPNSNGSQFFITEVATPWLDGKHTIFGEVIEGLDVVDTLSNIPTGAQDKPTEKQEILAIEIIRKGESFQEYNGATFFHENKEKISEKNAAFFALQQQKIADKVAKIKEGMLQTESGLMYKKVIEKNEKSPEKGHQVSVHYAGLFENGSVFDSSYVRQQPLEFQVGTGQVIAGWDEGILLLNKGEKAILWIPSNLAYGKYGAGGVIPPDTNLIFEVELVDC